MSRSTRRAYAAVTGTASAKEDKRVAHRNARHEQNRAIEACTDFEDLLLPHRLECAHNNPYSWVRDGAQHYMSARCEAEDETARRYVEKLMRK
jgi:hypothetical protein